MKNRRSVSAVCAVVVAGILVLVGAPAAMAYFESGKTSTYTTFNPVPGCHVYYGGSNSTDQAIATDIYNQCSGSVGARLYFKTPGSGSYSGYSNIAWDPNYARSDVVNAFVSARGYYSV